MQGYVLEDLDIYFCVTCLHATERDGVKFPEAESYIGGNGDAECIVCLRNLEALKMKQAA